MAGFQKKWTEQQKNAVVGEVLDHRRKLPAVLKDAKEGKLVAGLAPFDMPYATAADYIKAAKRERRPNLARNASADTIAFQREVVERTATLLDENIRKMEKQRGVVDLGELERALKVADRVAQASRELAAATAREGKSGPASSQAKPNTTNTAQPSGRVGQMLSEAKGQDETGAGSPQEEQPQAPAQGGGPEDGGGEGPATRRARALDAPGPPLPAAV